MRPALDGAGRAFTLIELVVVMLVASILSVAVLPAINSMGESRETAVVDEIGRSLESARAHAIGTGSQTGVRFSLRAQSFTTRTIAPGTRRSVVLPDSSDRDVIRLAELHPGIRMRRFVIVTGRRGADSIWFTPEGVAVAGSGSGPFAGSRGELRRNATLTIAADGSQGRTITIHRITGAIER